MPTSDDEPTTDDRRPTTNIGGDVIGGNQINAQGSQAYIGQAQTVTQNFIRTDAPPRSDDAETLAGALRAALAPRRSLLILDDVWELGLRAAKLLRDCGSPDCRALASSRSPRIAQEVAKGAPPLALDVLEAVPA